MTETWVKDMNDNGKQNQALAKIISDFHCVHHTFFTNWLWSKSRLERPATDHNTQRTALFQKMKSDYEPPPSKQATSTKRDTWANQCTYTAAETVVKIYCLCIAIITLMAEQYTKPGPLIENMYTIISKTTTTEIQLHLNCNHHGANGQLNSYIK